MQTRHFALIAASLLTACSSTPEPNATESPEPVATALASADIEAAPVETAAPVEAVAAPEPAADLVVAPMKISVDAKHSIELKADKGFYVKAKKVATLDKNVLQLEGMSDKMEVFKDGSIVMSPASPKKLKFNDKDEVEIEGGGKISIDDKGKITVVAVEGKPQPKDFKPTITGFKPEARRAATLGLLLLMTATTSEVKTDQSKASVPATQ